jgi:type I restriction enzyme S subunit
VSVSEWREAKLCDIGEIVGGGTPSTKEESYYGGDIPWITPKDLSTHNERYIYRGERSITEEGLKNSSAKLMPKGTVLFSSRAPIGYVAIAGKELCTNQGFKSLIPKNGVADSEFIYYLFKHKKSDIEAIASGTTFLEVSGSAMKNISILLPPLPEQKAIAVTLSVLDDMIELNNQINKTLEEMAQAIFKSWFVDFEPFKDEEFEESELGLIPKGWRVGKLSDVGEIIGGGTPSKSKPEYYSKKGIPWITPKDLSINKNKYISRGEIDISELGLRESSARLMPKGTVLFSSRAPIGYIAIAKNAVTTNQGFKSVVPFENISSEYIYLLLKNSINEIESRATGSTFKEISGGEMKKVPIILPPKEIIRKFNEIATTLGKIQASLEDENNILMSIRDTLLPKLMSGEIRVPVEEVV